LRYWFRDVVKINTKQKGLYPRPLRRKISARRTIRGTSVILDSVAIYPLPYFGQRGRDQLPYSLEGALPHYVGQCGHLPVATLFGRRGCDPLPWLLESVMSKATEPCCLILWKGRCPCFGQRGHSPVAILFGQRGRDPLPYSLESAAVKTRCIIYLKRYCRDPLHHFYVMSVATETR